MKKFFGLVCALALALTPVALAEEEEVSLPEGAVQLQLGEAAEADLDGDGEAETILIQSGGEDEVDSPEIIVTKSDGSACTATVGLGYGYVNGMYLIDLDGDGKPEILITGDEVSSDYYTWCFRYDGQSLTAVQFADAGRDENTGEYADCGYGLIIAVNGNQLTMMGSQDVLGTWMCSRVFTLTGDRFELQDGGLWQMEDLTGDANAWEYRCLTAKAEIDAHFEDGTDGKIEVGTKLMPTQTDKLSVVYFVTQDGQRGSIDIAPNEAEGFGYLIGGAADYDCFESLPYAD